MEQRGQCRDVRKLTCRFKLLSYATKNGPRKGLNHEQMQSWEKWDPKYEYGVRHCYSKRRLTITISAVCTCKQSKPAIHLLPHFVFHLSTVRNYYAIMNCRSGKAARTPPQFDLALAVLESKRASILTSLPPRATHACRIETDLICKSMGRT